MNILYIVNLSFSGSWKKKFFFLSSKIYISTRVLIYTIKARFSSDRGKKKQLRTKRYFETYVCVRERETVESETDYQGQKIRSLTSRSDMVRGSFNLHWTNDQSALVERRLRVCVQFFFFQRTENFLIVSRLIFFFSILQALFCIVA